MDSPAPPIPYEEMPLREGLTVERRSNDREIRVIVPAPRNWRRLPGFAGVAMLSMAALALFFTVAGLLHWRAADRDPLLIHGSLYAAVLGLVLLVVHQRLYRSMLFQLTADALTMTVIAPTGRRVTRTWQRGAVAAIEVDAAGENLLLRLRNGQRGETIAYFVGSREVAEAVATALGQALAALPALPDRPEVLPTEPLAGADALPTRRLSKLLWSACGLLAAVAVLFFLTGHVCGAAYLLMLAAAPAALALGIGASDVYL